MKHKTLLLATVFAGYAAMASANNNEVQYGDQTVYQNPYSAPYNPTTDYVAPLRLEVINAGEAQYVTGGVGDEERNAMLAMKKEFNVHITSASTRGEFKGTTRIVVLDGSGQEIINAESGPLFYAKLPAGSYTLQASNGGQMKTQRLTVSNSRPINTTIRWL